MDIEKLPTFFTWVKQNWVTFLSVSFVCIAMYGVYQFINGYAKPFGAALASQHEDLKRAVASYAALDTILTRDIARFKASRVGLFRFHDIEHSNNKNAFFFVSVANMVAAPGIAIDLPSITNLPASLFTPVLSSLSQHQSVMTIVAELEPGPLKDLAQKRGSRTILWVPIDDLQDNLIGFITLAWLSDGDVPTGKARDEMIAVVQADATRISGYFSVSSLGEKFN